MARMYDPETARFLQEDSYRGAPNDPLSLNLYTYCHNNPVIHDDPNGHALHIAAGALLGGVISTAITAARDYLDDKKFNSGWKEYAGSFAEGAIAGGVGAATGGASIFATKVAGAGAGFAGNITKQLITKGKINWKEAAISTAIDAGIAVAGNYAGKIVKNSKVGKYLASKAADLAEKAKKQAVDLVLKGKAFNQAWKESKPNTVTLGSGFGALQAGIDRTKIAMKKVAEGGTGAVKKNEVGLFNDLQAKSIKGDGLDIHHVGQKHPMGQIIEGYNPPNAPSIAIPRREHINIPTIKGDYTGTARELLAKDIMDLRKYSNAPNSALKELIELNKSMYPQSFIK